MKLWKRDISELSADALRSAAWCVLLVNGMLLALFSVWFTWHALGHLRDWCWRTLFVGDW